MKISHLIYKEFVPNSTGILANFFLYDNGSHWTACYANGSVVSEDQTCDKSALTASCNSSNLCSQLDNRSQTELPFVTVPIPNYFLFKLEIRQGWNLVGIPLSLQLLISNTCGKVTIYEYNGKGYDEMGIENWHPNHAYWIYSKNACEITYGGSLENEITPSNYHQTLNMGWNMVTAPINSVLFNQIEGSCKEHITSGPWKYTKNGYEKTNSIAAFDAYWIKVDNECTLGQ